jgi:hypothetical protein
MTRHRNGTTRNRNDPMHLEATPRDFEFELAAVEVRTGEGRGKVATSVDRVKSPTLDGSASWAVFHR